VSDAAGSARASRSAGGVTAVLVAATVWGTTGTATHFAPGVPAAVFGAVTFGLGGLVFAALTGRRAVRAVTRPGGRRWVALGAASLVVYAVAFYGALDDAGVALGTTVAIGSSPLFAGLVEWAADRRRVTRRWVVATVVSVVGMVVVTLARSGATGDERLLAGLGAALLAGLTYATYSWAVARGLGAGTVVGATTGGAGAGAAALPVVTASDGRGIVGAVFGLAAVPLTVLAVVVGRDDLAVGANWPVFLYLALVPTVLGHSLYALGLRRTSASAATLLSLFEPVVAAVLAVLVVGERLGVAGWTGIALVVVGLAVLAVPAGAGKGGRAGPGA